MAGGALEQARAKPILELADALGHDSGGKSHLSAGGGHVAGAGDACEYVKVTDSSHLSPVGKKSRLANAAGGRPSNEIVPDGDNRYRLKIRKAVLSYVPLVCQQTAAAPYSNLELAAARWYCLAGELHDAVEDAGTRPRRTRPEQRHYQRPRGADRFGRRHLRGGGPARVRDRCAHRLSAGAARRCAAAIDRGSVESPQVLLPEPSEGRAARRGNVAVWRRAAVGRLDRHRHVAHEPRPGSRLRQSDNHGRERHHQSRHHRCRLGRGLLLRARSLEPAGLHRGRQPRHELGRCALPEVRGDYQQRARASHRADGRRNRRDWRPVPRFRGLRFPRPHRRLRGPVRHRH